MNSLLIPSIPHSLLPMYQVCLGSDGVGAMRVGFGIHTQQVIHTKCKRSIRLSTMEMAERKLEGTSLRGESLGEGSALQKCRVTLLPHSA